jgi:hypothetical protein
MFRRGLAPLVSWTILLSAAPAQAQSGPAPQAQPAPPAHAESAAPAQSGWWSRFCADVHRGYHRNNAWPEPFFWGDREATMKPFGIQVANGWRRQNLLSDYHFNEANPQLNLAGESKLRYILTQMPPNRRTVFVQRGLTPDETAMRVELVQRAANRMSTGGYIADIVESDLPNDGWPADDVNAIAQRFQATRPDPRLKNASSGDGGGSGGSNGQ